MNDKWNRMTVAQLLHEALVLEEKGHPLGAMTGFLRQYLDQMADHMPALPMEHCDPSIRRAKTVVRIAPLFTDD